MSADPYFLSVIIPAFNEAKRLEISLPQLISFLKRQPYTSEIVFINDGSADSSAPTAAKYLAGFPHQILDNKTNRGKGAAVRQGMMAARGQVLLFTDADLAISLDHVNEFTGQLKSGYDIVIGSKALKGARADNRQPFLRLAMSRVYNLFARLFVFKNIADSQCGFKCFKRETARGLFAIQKLDNFSFDAEVLYLAQRKKYKILELPVKWNNPAQTTVSILADPFAMFIDLIRIRLIHWKTA